MKSGMNSTGKLDLVRVSGEFELSEFEISGFYSTNKRQKNVCEVNRAKHLLRKDSFKAEGSVTFQNIFSSLADFCDVVSVMLCIPGPQNGHGNLRVSSERNNMAYANSRSDVSVF